jgi:hypothetical protein
MFTFDGAGYDFQVIHQGFSIGPARYGDLIGEILPCLTVKWDYR